MTLLRILLGAGGIALLASIAFIVPLPFLGNVWAAVWIVWRVSALATRLKPAA